MTHTPSTNQFLEESSCASRVWHPFFQSMIRKALIQGACVHGRHAPTQAKKLQSGRSKADERGAPNAAPLLDDPEQFPSIPATPSCDWWVSNSSNFAIAEVSLLLSSLAYLQRRWASQNKMDEIFHSFVRHHSSTLSYCPGCHVFNVPQPIPQ